MSSAPSALITGVTGQDGSFLAELLLEKGYEVWGLVRRSPEEPLGLSEHLRGRLELVQGDLLEPQSLGEAIERTRPREIYHLAAPSFVPASWERPQATMRAIVGASIEIVERVREIDDTMRVFVSSSGAIFGESGESPQREDTPCRPITPYGVAKLASLQMVALLRSHAGVFACSGIAFNHESERRPERFVTRRISRGVAAIALGMQQELSLGSLDAVRDWCFAGDVVEAAWKMLQQDEPADYVLASGVPHTVAEFAEAAFACVGLEADRHLRVDPDLVRAKEGTLNVGDPSRARRELGWRAQVGFEELVRRMVEADLRSLRELAAA